MMLLIQTLFKNFKMCHRLPHRGFKIHMNLTSVMFECVWPLRRQVNNKFDLLNTALLSAKITYNNQMNIERK